MRTYKIYNSDFFKGVEDIKAQNKVEAIEIVKDRVIKEFVAICKHSASVMGTHINVNKVERCFLINSNGNLTDIVISIYNGGVIVKVDDKVKYEYILDAKMFEKEVKEFRKNNPNVKVDDTNVCSFVSDKAIILNISEEAEEEAQNDVKPFVVVKSEDKYVSMSRFSSITIKEVTSTLNEAKRVCDSLNKWAENHLTESDILSMKDPANLIPNLDIIY